MKSFVVAYDVFGAKRRYRVAKLVDAYKLEGQKSSWESVLDRKSMRSLIEELDKVLATEDKLNLIAVVGEPILLGKAKCVEIQKGGIVIV